MSTENIDVKEVLAKDIDRFMAQVETSAIQALRETVEVVRDNVLNLTPRWTGELQSGVLIRELDDGRQQEIYGGGSEENKMKFLVFEGNPPAGPWRAMPPHQPLKDWAIRKLGKTPKEADGFAFGVRRKIFRRGMQLPLAHDGRGQMFHRTFETMRQTRFHFVVFASALRQQIRQKTGG